MMNKKIDTFDGENSFLSNFFFSPFVYKGIPYLNAEAAYQSMKTLDVNKRMFFSDSSPKLAKKFGRKLKIREDWEDVKLEVMLDIVRTKFRNKDLKEKLLSTGDAYLEEGNYWNDTFWGVCNGVGKNHLGNILMLTREELKLGEIK